MEVRDRLTSGLIAGLVAGIVLDAVHYLSISLGIAELAYWDWASFSIFGFRTTNPWEMLLAVLVQLFFAGLVGVLFAYLIKSIKSKNLILKGIFYSLSVWFLLNAIVHVLNVTALMPIRFDTAASNVVGVTIYGYVLTKTLQWLEKRYNIET